MNPIPQTKAQWAAFIVYLATEYGLGKTTLVKANSTFELLVEQPFLWLVSKVKKLFSKGDPNVNKPTGT